MVMEHTKIDFKISEQGAPIVNNAFLLNSALGQIATLSIDLRSKYCECTGVYGEDDKNGECGVYIEATKGSLSLKEDVDRDKATLITFPGFKGWKVFVAGYGGKYTVKVCLTREHETRVDPAETLRKFMNSDEGKAAIKKIEEERQETEAKRDKTEKQVEQYLKKNSFISLLLRCLDEIERSKKQAEKTNTYPIRSNNKIWLLFNYACKHGKKVKHVKGITDIGFTNECYQYDGYYFRTMWGQGVGYNIFDPNLEMVFSD